MTDRWSSPLSSGQPPPGLGEACEKEKRSPREEKPPEKDARSAEVEAWALRKETGLGPVLSSALGVFRRFIGECFYSLPITLPRLFTKPKLLRITGSSGRAGRRFSLALGGALGIWGSRILSQGRLRLDFEPICHVTGEFRLHACWHRAKQVRNCVRSIQEKLHKRLCLGWTRATSFNVLTNWWPNSDNRRHGPIKSAALSPQNQFHGKSKRFKLLDQHIRGTCKVIYQLGSRSGITKTIYIRVPIINKENKMVAENTDNLLYRGLCSKGFP